MAQSKKCAHPSCQCQAREGSKYCSPYCQAAGTTVEIQCNCGHAECSAATAAKA